MCRSKRSLFIILIFILLAFILSSCSFVRIQNVSAARATVLVRVPDSGKAYVRNISSGAIVDVFSSHGGSYTITMIPGEAYRNTLNSLRSQIENRLFNERQSLTTEELAQLTENLNHINKLIEDLQKPGETCSGYLPDYETVVVTIAFDNFSNTWELSCGSGSP